MTVNNIIFSDVTPTKNQMVIFDGYDEFDKEDALAIFHLRTQSEIYLQLKKGKLGNMTDIEDLFVMEGIGVRYYMMPYIKYIKDNIAGDFWDNETVHFFFYFLKQYIENKGIEFLSSYESHHLFEISCEAVDRISSRNGDVNEWTIKLLKDLVYVKVIIQK